MSEQLWNKGRQPRGGGCAVSGCDNPDWSRRLCHKHYQKWHKYGDPCAGREEARKKGQGSINRQGYLEHRRGEGTRMAHRQIVETMIGRKLPQDAVIHHVNGDPLDNRPGNLVVCPDDNYHKLLHRRQRAFDACGRADWRKCCRCGKWDDPANMSIVSAGRKSTQAYHKACNAKHVREMKRRRPA